MLLTRLTPIRAVRAISIVTTLVTLASGAAMHLIDPREFPTVGRGLWWAAQTVTTVGYGDVVPHATAGRALALAVMVCAVAFLTVVTGSITAALIQLEQRRLAALNDTIDDLGGHTLGNQHHPRRELTAGPARTVSNSLWSGRPRSTLACVGASNSGDPR